MAASKRIVSTTSDLKVARAGKEWECCGTFVERGHRPGNLKDVWMLGRSRRCMGVIPAHALFVVNRKIPDFLESNLRYYSHFFPTCLHCAMDAYPEYFHGTDKALYMKPMSDEDITKARDRIVRLLANVRQFKPGEQGGESDGAEVRTG